jgi:hypothetical protein
MSVKTEAEFEKLKVIGRIGPKDAGPDGSGSPQRDDDRRVG